MKVYNSDKTDYVETRCNGCMCHTMNMVFGTDPNKCAECGCPLTMEGWNKMKAEQSGT